jgi:type IV fimbrial biogenesis protein FimT
MAKSTPKFAVALNVRTIYYRPEKTVSLFLIAFYQPFSKSCARLYQQAIELMRARSKGLTLIELMIVITLAGVLVALAIPNFRDFVRRNRLATQSNEFIAAVQFARSEAIRRNRNISLLAADASDNANEWGKGWQVVDPLTAATLRVAPTLPRALALDSSVNNVSVITFNSDGLLQAGADVYRLCDPEKSGRRIEITTVGKTTHTAIECD